MAKNYVSRGHEILAVASYPTEPASGDPVLVGTLAGVAVEDEGASVATKTMIATRGVFTLPIVGHDGSTDAGIAVGDKVYYDSNIPGLNVNSSTGSVFGKALGAIDAGDTGTIPILLIQA